MQIYYNLQILNPEYDSGLNSVDDDSDDDSGSESDEEEAENSDTELKVNGNKINGHSFDDEEETDGSEIDEQSSDGDQDNTEQLKLALHKAMMSANQHSDDVIIINKRHGCIYIYRGP